MWCVECSLDYALLSRKRVKRTQDSSTIKWSRVWCVWRGVNAIRVPLQCDCAVLCPSPSCLPEVLPPIVHSSGGQPTLSSIRAVSLSSTNLYRYSIFYICVQPPSTVSFPQYVLTKDSFTPVTRYARSKEWI